MTASQASGAAAPAIPYQPLGEAESRRAVDLIESAERETPYCLCGSMTAAVAHEDVIWLECTTLRESKHGLSGLLSRLSAGFGHTRRVIVDLAERRS